MTIISGVVLLVVFALVALNRRRRRVRGTDDRPGKKE
jgi:hypothetical protein